MFSLEATKPPPPETLKDNKICIIYQYVIFLLLKNEGNLSALKF